jgi:malate dehydrogenase (oxaloacetate-decarboxylating)
MKRDTFITHPETGEKYQPVSLRGLEVTRDPMLNKGTAFPERERDELGLRGLLPPTVSSMEQQLERVYENYRRQPNDLAKYLYLIALQDRNEALFYRFLLEHLEEMTPIVYTPTVGQACQQYSHIYRRGRGLYITPADRGRMGKVVANTPSSNVAVIVATDGEGILGIGDQGAGGIGIAIGKLTLYTAAAGIHPARCLPIVLDVGTNNPSLRDDPLYLGVHAPRLRGDAYLDVIDRFVEAVEGIFPRALLQWEDFSRQNAWTVLERYRDRVCSFNDDIQGTGAVVMGGIEVVTKITGRRLTDHRFCVHGLGAGGGGIVWVLIAALRERGLSQKEALERIVGLDSRGLVLADRPGLESFKRVFAREPELVAEWKLKQPGEHIGLLDAVKNFRPTVLIGTSGQPGCFTEEIVEQMAQNAERPAIFALSNPTSKTEVHPADALAWTGGRALVATGSPFPPVEYGGRSWEISQGNNVFCFPGIGLGVLASGARRVTDGMLLAASRAVAEQVDSNERAAARLYPPVREIRLCSEQVALAVAEAALATGAVPETEAEHLSSDVLAERIKDEMWYPDYVPYRYVASGNDEKL